MYDAASELKHPCASSPFVTRAQVSRRTVEHIQRPRAHRHSRRTQGSKRELGKGTLGNQVDGKGRTNVHSGRRRGMCGSGCGPEPRRLEGSCEWRRYVREGAEVNEGVHYRAGLRCAQTSTTVVYVQRRVIVCTCLYARGFALTSVASAELISTMSIQTAKGPSIYAIINASPAQRHNS